MRYRDALADLESRQPERIVPDLDRIRALVDLLDHPEHTYPTVHVAGTNGKTTTTRLTSLILCGHGLASGAYTSPHLLRVNERISLCDEPISDDELAETYGHLLPYLERVDGMGERVTYFEVLTALAYLWFADKPVDVGVFEVGMGGRWDATNLIRGEVALLTPISLDHPELGSTVAEVAAEKADVLKAETRAIVRAQPHEAMEVVEARASEVGATLLVEGREWSLSGRDLAVGGQVLAVKGLHAEYTDLAVALHGEHQAHNVAAAVVAAEAMLGRALEEDVTTAALDGVSSPGRMDVVALHPMVVLDGAHNPAGAEALAASLDEAFIWQRLHLVIGCLSTKDVRGVVSPLASRADHAYACANSNPKSLDPTEMAAACESSGLPATPFDDVATALSAAREAAEEEDLILVTGSLYTVADALTEG